jgi:aerobic carbon-monoxide dehydrogenase small subunit
VNVSFHLNDREISIEVPAERRLLDLLRGGTGLAGTAEGCGRGYCGSCLVFLDGEVVASCLVPAFRVSGRRVTTIERLRDERLFVEMEEAVDDLIPAGPCRAGLLVTLYSLLVQVERMNRDDFVAALSGNVCPCTGYRQLHERLRRFASLRGRRWQSRRSESTSRLPGI